MHNRKGNSLSFDPSLFIPFNDRSYDLVVLSDWEKQIHFDPPAAPVTHFNDEEIVTEGSHNIASFSLSNPRNLFLDSDDWLQTIIWDVREPFHDFRLLPYDPEPLRTHAPPISTKIGPSVPPTGFRLLL